MARRKQPHQEAGGNIDFSESDLEKELFSEEEDNEAFIAYEIASYPSDLTLAGIRDMWVQNDIVIPDFQRKFVWNIRQASLLIESFLLGLPVPQVFFYVNGENKSVVIDGQQRIMSVVYFFEGYFGDESISSKRQIFRLTGLDDRSAFANKRYVDLDEMAQRKLRQSVLRAINIRQLAPKDENTSIYHIFERLNTGGTPLKPQEIRNCVFRGEFVDQLRELNADKNWRLIINQPKFDKHQKDVELILRVFSLSSSHWIKYEKPMKEFLNVAMSREKSGNSKKVENFLNVFPQATDLIIKALGNKPFHLRGPLNTSALDAVMVTVIDHINQIPQNFNERFKRLIDDPLFYETTLIATSDASTLHSRFDLVRQILVD